MEHQEMEHQQVGCAILADRHTSLSEGIRGLLETTFKTVYIVADAASLKEGAQRLSPAVVVLDISLLGSDFPSLLKEVLESSPESRVIVLSVHDQASVARIALASGANFIARTSSSDSNGTARVIMEAIRHPGFSLVQILSPCVTFRPEQRDWRNLVKPAQMDATSDPAQAARRLLTDEGLYTGILFRGDRPAYQPRPEASIDNIAELDEEFRI